MLDILKRALDAFTKGDWNACRATLADDAVYEEPGTHVRVDGADDFIGALKQWKRAFPDVTFTVIDSLESQDLAMLEVEWQGTQSGPLEGPFGSFEATNKPGLLKAVIVAKFRDDRIVEERHYFDLLTILSQIGAGPSLGAKQPPTRPAAEAQPLH